MRIAAEEATKMPDGSVKRFTRVERDSPEDLLDRMILVVPSETAVNINREDNRIVLTFTKVAKK